ncbi:MAG: hypothetical protein SFU86_25295 [Pirellulaceae bacterium]|nr:hypothetical protein [Pirellulaceae bacterium]
MSSPPFDLSQAHRWFAVECNNGAWDLLESASRTPDETLRLLHLAHAAAWHWDAVGGDLHRQRAECLLATAHTAANDAAAALRHAERCLSRSVASAATETPFDRATALGCAARAHSLAGNLAQAERLRTLAEAAAAALSADEQAVFRRFYG